MMPVVENMNFTGTDDEHRIWPKWSECLVHSRKLRRLQQPFFSGGFSVILQVSTNWCKWWLNTY